MIDKERGWEEGKEVGWCAGGFYRQEKLWGRASKKKKNLAKTKRNFHETKSGSGQFTPCTYSVLALRPHGLVVDLEDEVDTAQEGVGGGARAHTAQAEAVCAGDVAEVLAGLCTHGALWNR